MPSNFYFIIIVIIRHYLRTNNDTRLILDKRLILDLLVTSSWRALTPKRLIHCLMCPIFLPNHCFFCILDKMRDYPASNLFHMVSEWRMYHGAFKIFWLEFLSRAGPRPVLRPSIHSVEEEMSSSDSRHSSDDSSGSDDPDQSSAVPNSLSLLESTALRRNNSMSWTGSPMVLRFTRFTRPLSVGTFLQSV